MTTPPPRKIRVFVVDDSAVVRRLVTDALKTDPDIEVVGTAMDPYIARNKLKDLEPDVMTLDIEMPRMDGLTFLQLIMEHRPMPVIIMSSLTQRGSHAALEALQLGAIDVLGKPDGSSSFGDLGPQLIEKVKAAAIAKLKRRSPPPGVPPETPASPQDRPRKGAADRSKETGATAAQPAIWRPTPLPTIAKPAAASASQLLCRDPRALILLGASTGGTEALSEILTKLPNTLPPIAIVQHIPPRFSRPLPSASTKFASLRCARPSTATC